MPRNITITFEDGSQHKYNGVPDDVTPDEVISRASSEFSGKTVANVDGGAKETSLLEDAQQVGADIAGAFGGVGKQLLYDVPETVASFVGADDVAASLRRRGEEFTKATKTLGMSQDAVDVGEAVGTGIATGAILSGAGMFTAGTRFASWLSGGGKVRKTVGKVLDEAATDPAKIMAIEGAIGGISETSAKGVEAATGSSALGAVAGVIAGGAAGFKMYDNMVDGLNLVKAGKIEARLAKNLSEKYTPQQITQFQDDAAFMAREGLEARLDLVTQDATMAQTLKNLEMADQSLVPVIKWQTEQASKAITDTMDAITRGRLDAGDINLAIGEIRDGFLKQVDSSVAQVEASLGTATAKEASENMYSVFDGFFTEAKNAIDDAYKAVDFGQVIKTKEAKRLLMKGIKDATKTKAVDKRGVIPKSVKKARKMLAKEVDKGMKIGGLKDVRSHITDLARKATAAGKLDEARRLKKMSSSITKVFDNHKGSEAFVEANTLYKAVNEIADMTSIHGFFSKNALGVDRLAPEQFASRFLHGPTALNDGRKALEFAKTARGRDLGLKTESIRETAHNALLSTLKASARGKTLTESQAAAFVSKNEDIIKLYDLEDQFNNIKSLTSRAKNAATGIKELDTLVLGKYGISGNPHHLRTLTKNGTLEREISKIPRVDRASVRRAALHSFMFDKQGMRPMGDILTDLNLYGKSLGLKKSMEGKLARLANLSEQPAGNTRMRIEDFDKYFENIDFPDRAKSAALERITRPLLKGIRILNAGVGIERNRSAREKIRTLMMTEGGIDKVLSLAKKSPDSRVFVRWILGRGTSAVSQASAGEQ